MNKNNIGRCYELNYKFVTNHHDYILVHGYITNLFPPYQTLDHAWCMKDNIVYDAVQEKEYELEAYNTIFKAEIDKQYTIEEVFECALKYGTYGCWHELRDLNLEKYYNGRELKYGK